jgi:hypothetical protein
MSGVARLHGFLQKATLFNLWRTKVRNRITQREQILKCPQNLYINAFSTVIPELYFKEFSWTNDFTIFTARALVHLITVTQNLSGWWSRCQNRQAFKLDLNYIVPLNSATKTKTTLCYAIPSLNHNEHIKTMQALLHTPPISTNSQVS